MEFLFLFMLNLNPLTKRILFWRCEFRCQPFVRSINVWTLLVYHFHVHLKECNLLLTQWKAHEAQFPNVTCQVLGISKSQIETKCIFNMNGILTSLQRCKLGVKNIDKLVMVFMKYWRNDVQMEFNEKGGVLWWFIEWKDNND